MNFLLNTKKAIILIPSLFCAFSIFAQTEEVFLVTDFDGGGILPSTWESFGDLGLYGVQRNNSLSDGKYYELAWNGTSDKGYIVSQSGITFRLIPKKKLKGKTIDNVFLRLDVNCGGAPGTVVNIVLVDGPNDCCKNEVNWQYTFTKDTCEWETLEINLADFGYAYGSNNHEKTIDFTKVGRVKIGINPEQGPKKQVVQFDNVELVVKENVTAQGYQPNIVIPESTTLKTAAKDFFVGVAVNPERVRATDHSSVYTREFNSITAENAMKMKSIFKGLDENMKIIYDWTQSDAIVDFAENNGMNLHGHALVWHESIPDVLENFKGTNAQFEAIIGQYITTVVKRYKGKVDSWDVVNEAIADNTTKMRESLFLERMGSNYVEKCFEFARKADNKVKLFYNDYGLEHDVQKQKGAFELIDGLKNKNLIDGVGYQMHLDYNFPSKATLQTATNLAVDRGLLIHFSELDIKTNPKGDVNELTEQRNQAQAKKVYEVVSVYNNIPENLKYALTVWGLKDDESWITPRYGFPDWPLLFDANFKRKKAFSGFVQALE